MSQKPRSKQISVNDQITFEDMEGDLEYATDEGKIREHLKSSKLKANLTMDHQIFAKCDSEISYIPVNRSLYSDSTFDVEPEELTSSQMRDVLNNWNCFSVLQSALCFVNQKLIKNCKKDEQNLWNCELSVIIDDKKRILGAGRAKDSQTAKHVAATNAVHIILDSNMSLKKYAEEGKGNSSKTANESAGSMPNNNDCARNHSPGSTSNKEDEESDDAHALFMYKVRNKLLLLIKDLFMNVRIFCNLVPANMTQKRNIWINSYQSEMSWKKELFNENEPTIEDLVKIYGPLCSTPNLSSAEIPSSFVKTRSSVKKIGAIELMRKPLEKNLHSSALKKESRLKKNKLEILNAFSKESVKPFETSFMENKLEITVPKDPSTNIKRKSLKPLKKLSKKMKTIASIQNDSTNILEPATSELLKVSSETVKTLSPEYLKVSSETMKPQSSDFLKDSLKIMKAGPSKLSKDSSEIERPVSSFSFKDLSEIARTKSSVSLKDLPEIARTESSTLLKDLSEIKGTESSVLLKDLSEIDRTDSSVLLKDKPEIKRPEEIMKPKSSDFLKDSLKIMKAGPSKLSKDSSEIERPVSSFSFKDLSEIARNKSSVSLKDLPEIARTESSTLLKDLSEIEGTESSVLLKDLSEIDRIESSVLLKDKPEIKRPEEIMKPKSSDFLKDLTGILRTEVSAFVNDFSMIMSTAESSISKDSSEIMETVSSFLKELSVKDKTECSSLPKDTGKRNDPLAFPEDSSESIKEESVLLIDLFEKENECPNSIKASSQMTNEECIIHSLGKKENLVCPVSGKRAESSTFVNDLSDMKAGTSINESHFEINDLQDKSSNLENETTAISIKSSVLMNELSEIEEVPVLVNELATISNVLINESMETNVEAASFANNSAEIETGGTMNISKNKNDANLEDDEVEVIESSKNANEANTKSQCSLSGNKTTDIGGSKMNIDNDVNIICEVVTLSDSSEVLDNTKSSESIRVKGIKNAASKDVKILKCGISNSASVRESSSKTVPDFCDSSSVNDGSIFHVWNCCYFVQRAFAISKIALFESYTKDDVDSTDIKCTLKANIGNNTWILRIGEGKSGKEARWYASLLTLKMIFENESPIQIDTVSPMNKFFDRPQKDEAKISGDNVGAKMLKLMGWNGGGLGKKGEGIKEPVNLQANYGREGIGAVKNTERPPPMYMNRIKSNVTNLIRSFVNENYFQADNSKSSRKTRNSNKMFLQESTIREHIKFLVDQMNGETPKVKAKKDSNQKGKQTKVASSAVQIKANAPLISSTEGSMRVGIIPLAKSTSQTESLCAAFLDQLQGDLILRFMRVKKYEGIVWLKIIEDSLRFCFGDTMMCFFEGSECAGGFEFSFTISKKRIANERCSKMILSKGIGKTKLDAKREAAKNVLEAFLKKCFLIVIKKRVSGDMIKLERLFVSNQSDPTIIGKAKAKGTKNLSNISKVNIDPMVTPRFMENVNQLVDAMVKRKLEEELVPDLVFSNELSLQQRDYITKYLKLKNYHNIIEARTYGSGRSCFIALVPVVDSAKLFNKINEKGGKTDKYEVFAPGTLTSEDFFNIYI